MVSVLDPFVIKALINLIICIDSTFLQQYVKYVKVCNCKLVSDWYCDTWERANEWFQTINVATFLGINRGHRNLRREWKGVRVRTSCHKTFPETFCGNFSVTWGAFCGPPKRTSRLSIPWRSVLHFDWQRGKAPEGFWVFWACLGKLASFATSHRRRSPYLILGIAWGWWEQKVSTSCHLVEEKRRKW